MRRWILSKLYPLLRPLADASANARAHLAHSNALRALGRENAAVRRAAAMELERDEALRERDLAETLLDAARREAGED